jgi:hypothetical protein
MFFAELLSSDLRSAKCPFVSRSWPEWGVSSEPGGGPILTLFSRASDECMIYCQNCRLHYRKCGTQRDFQLMKLSLKTTFLRSYRCEEGRPTKELFSAPAATYFLKLIDGAETYVETLAVQPDPEKLARIRKIYSDARAELHRRLHQHGVSH